jgi:hypothetical protein
MTMKRSNEVLQSSPAARPELSSMLQKGGVWISGFSAGLVELSGPARP